MAEGTRGGDVETTLGRPDVHATWEDAYYNRDTVAFYDSALDVIAAQFGGPGGTVLDAGCGQGYHAIRLAHRGYRVEAVDFSEHVLDVARAYVDKAELTDRIHLQRENLVELSFPDATFQNVLCWGVLMHIPDVGAAVRELARVLAPGGLLAVSEGNHRSLDAVGIRLMRRLMRRRAGGPRTVSTSEGLETWKEMSAGALMTRQADVGWLIAEFERRGLHLEDRRAGEFTELYTKIRAPLVARTIHRFNLVWFNRIKFDRVASGSLLFFRKPAPNG